MRLKTCIRCNIKKSVEIAFKDDARNVCDQCLYNSDKEREHKQKGYVFENHLWTTEDEGFICECKRCGVLRKRSTNFNSYRQNSWKSTYLIKGKWSLEKVICNAIINPK
jgi:hypothetical protein